MDPTANINEQREIAARIMVAVDCADSAGDFTVDKDDAYRLAELVQSLDQWISGGGFLPARWVQA